MVIAVPLTAVIFTGERNLVFVLGDDGMLRPREILIGPVAGDFAQVLSGLREDETIVISANFLIDAESRIGGGMGGMPGMQMDPVRDVEDESGVRPAATAGSGSTPPDEGA
jgi:Cu(I)/Ag(I) efflux system membrane fusion protein